MSINNIKKLSMNPHFYSLLMQSFLSGYEKPCEIKLPFMAIPILLYAKILYLAPECQPRNRNI